MQGGGLGWHTIFLCTMNGPMIRPRRTARPLLNSEIPQRVLKAMHVIRLFLIIAATLALPGTAFAQEAQNFNLNMPGSTLGIIALIVFIGAYLLVMVEEFTHLRKSKPVILAAGIIWMLVAFAAVGHPELAQEFAGEARSEEHTSELQSLMRISYAVFCLKKKKIHHRLITYSV